MDTCSGKITPLAERDHFAPAKCSLGTWRLVRKDVGTLHDIRSWPLSRILSSVAAGLMDGNAALKLDIGPKSKSGYTHIKELRVEIDSI